MMRSYHFISVIVALLLSLASLSAPTAFSLKGTVTDSLGHYSLSIPNDKTVEIHYECLGYEGVVLTVSPETDPIKVTKQEYYDQEVTHQWQYRYLVDRINGIYIPKDIDEAIDTLDTILSAEDKQYVTDSLSLEAFVASTHLGLGMWMRNNWGLWGGSRLQRFFRDRQVFHPDDMSGEILKAYYKNSSDAINSHHVYITC